MLSDLFAEYLQSGKISTCMRKHHIAVLQMMIYLPFAAGTSSSDDEVSEESSDSDSDSTIESVQIGRY